MSSTACRTILHTTPVLLTSLRVSKADPAPRGERKQVWMLLVGKDASADGGFSSVWEWRERIAPQAGGTRTGFEKLLGWSRQDDREIRRICGGSHETATPTRLFAAW